MFGVLPELAGRYGWAGGIALLGGGAGVLWLFSRYVYPVCPSCSHTHDHEHCAAALHGFAAPLIGAAALHAFLDGVGISASLREQSGGLAAALLLAVTVHKIPEGIALGIMLRASMRSRRRAFALCAAVEGATFFGALFEAAITGRAGTAWVPFALALAAGSFAYLGFHAIHGEWRRRGGPGICSGADGRGGRGGAATGITGSVSVGDVIHAVSKRRFRYTPLDAVPTQLAADQ